MFERRPPGIRLREQPAAEERARLAAELNLPEGVAVLAWQRGIQDAQAWRHFTDLDPAADLVDPWLLPDMEKAVARLILAMERGESLLVHGDYDADGLTGTAILVRALRGLGVDARPFAPLREKDGYGLSRRAMENAVDKGVPPVGSVGCGSSGCELLAQVAARGGERVT
ncbi:single-stranded-DNA-specific exonuclease RecJ, partial [bacterium]|nr:single-stranded-DNA-specific exonuclease RecJ [bacterium]